MIDMRNDFSLLDR